MSTESVPPLQSAPLWRRLMAMGYDGLLIIAVIMTYGAIHLSIKVLLLGDAFKNHLQNLPAGSNSDPLMFIGTLISVYLFFYFFWHRSGQTLGMQVWRIKITSLNGKPVSASQTLLRLLVAPISLMCFGLGYGWCLIGEKRTWHDILTKTNTILLQK